MKVAAALATLLLLGGCASLRGRSDPAAAAVPLALKLKYGAGYLALALSLAVMAFEVHERLGPSH